MKRDPEPSQSDIKEARHGDVGSVARSHVPNSGTGRVPGNARSSGRTGASNSARSSGRAGASRSARVPGATAGFGPKPATLKDVAREAGVSLATASFVLSGRKDGQSAGSEATKEKVRAAARRLGYQPNRHAQAIRTGRAKTVVLALCDAPAGWAHRLTESVRRVARPEGLSTVFLADDAWHEFLHGFACDVALVADLDFDDSKKEKLERVVRSGVQLVVLTEQQFEGSCDVVYSRGEEAVRAAYVRLRENHERVAMLTAVVPEVSEYGRRMAAFAAAAREAGDAADASLFIPTGISPDDRFRYCMELLSSGDFPAGIVAESSDVAVAATAAARALGLTPHEVEIISIGTPAAHALPGVKVSHYGVPDFGERVARIVVERALRGEGASLVRHEFEWAFYPGDTMLLSEVDECVGLAAGRTGSYSV